MAIIVDTSAVVAIFVEAYAEHASIAQIVAASSEPLVVSPMIVAEVGYMLYTRFGAAAAKAFANDVVAEGYELAEWAVADHATALNVVDALGTDYVGVADASNVVLADRYRTTRLLTLDQRHFRSLRPIWGADHFTLLPYDV